MKKHLIVVVDDSRQFALHVLVTLMRMVFYRVGTATRDSRDHPLCEKELFVAPSGRMACCWIDAGERCSENLGTVLSQHEVGVSDVWVLVDVQGRQATSHIGKVLKDLVPYVARGIAHGRPDVHVKLVSSYASVNLESKVDALCKLKFGAELRQIYAKSPEFLRALRSEIERSVLAEIPVAQQKDSKAVCHVLVTGAGFERRRTAYGGVAFGVPDTYDMLLEMGRRSGALVLDKNRHSRRFPRVLDAGRSGDRWSVDDRRIASAEDRGNLDAWWDAIFEAATAGLCGEEGGDERRRAREWGLRKAYQQALLAVDHGHLVQCIHAAESDWDAWISTNYTGFCDRAMDLAMASQDELSFRKPWQAVCGKTASEVFEREHGSAGASRMFRWLFKICGDVRVVESMALGTRDKKSGGPASFMVVETNWFAVRAVKDYVGGLAATATERGIWFHIVGHSLYETNVLEVIAKALDSCSGELVLLVVDPEPEGPFAQLESMLEEREKARKSTGDFSVYYGRLKLTAEEYMTRLRLLTFGGGLAACEMRPGEWVRHVHSMSWSRTADIPASTGSGVWRWSGKARHGGKDENMREVFTWLHVSDIHGESGSEEHREERELVLQDALGKFRAFEDERMHPKPMALMVTGDVGGSGGAVSGSEYDLSLDWIRKACQTLGIDQCRAYMVPGNHDVNRDVVKNASADVAAQMEKLRSGVDKLVDARNEEAFRNLVRARFRAYLECQQRLHDRGKYGCGGLLWRDDLVMDHATVHVVGLNTALLAQDGADRGNLRLGRDLLKALPVDESALVLLLGHHPLSWLAEDDREQCVKWLRRRADLYLCGHEHEHSTNETYLKPCGELQQVVAGAMFVGEREKKKHGFNVTSVYEQGGKFILRLWPYVWVDEDAFFRLETEKTGSRNYYERHLSLKGG